MFTAFTITDSFHRFNNNQPLYDEMLDVPGGEEEDGENNVENTARGRQRNVLFWLFPTLYPSSDAANCWSARTLWHKTISIASSPAIFLTRIAIPLLIEER